MRRPALVTSLICLLGAATPLPGEAASKPPAQAATAAAATPDKVDPAFDAAKAAADALGPASIATLQRALILTGDLNAIATGEFGKRSFEAIKAFQKRNKGQETGILTAAEQNQLKVESDRTAAAYGFKSVTERGASVLYPAKIATKRTDGRRGPKFSAPGESVTVDILAYAPTDETYDALFDRLKKPRAGRSIEYSLKKPEFFVISGKSDGKSFYMRFLATKTNTAGFVVGWNPDLSPDFDRVPIVMASSLSAEGQILPAVATTDAGKPTAGTAVSEPAKVEPVGPAVPFEPGKTYGKRDGLGVVISAAGDLLTTADLVAGCETLAIAGGGSAKVIAGDPVNNIALARLDKPGAGFLALATTAPKAADTVTALALAPDGSIAAAPRPVLAADPATGDARRFRTDVAADAPTPVFYLDGAGALLSPVIAAGTGLKPLFVSAFLRAQGVAAGTAGGDPAKATVRLSCDRTQG